MKEINSNYDIMKENAKILFLKYNQSKMINKFSLDCNDNFLYITFFYRNYRINRINGNVEWSDNNFIYINEANFNEVMSIYDVLCYSKDNCNLSGEYALINSVNGSKAAAKPGKGLIDNCGDYFDKNVDCLLKACTYLKGIPKGKGDISYKLQVFDFLPIILEFWKSDDEFPASFNLLWDKNVLDYVHYETSFYIHKHIIDRMQEIMIIFKSLK